MTHLPTHSLGGTLTDGAHHLPIRIYWEDTDAGGIVYHASYIRFMERGRTEFLRALGLDQSRLASLPPEEAVLFVVRHMAVDYLKPAKLDDVLDLVTRPILMGGARLELLQTITRAGMPIAEARVTVVAITRDGRPCRIPDGTRRLIEPCVRPVPAGKAG